MAGRLATVLLLLALAVAAAGVPVAAQDPPDAPEPAPDAVEARLRLEIDPPGREKDLARFDDLVARGKVEEALTLAEKLLRGPRANDAFLLDKAGEPPRWQDRILTSLERRLRARLLALPPAARAAYDARHEGATRRLDELGRAGDRTALVELLARFPGSSRAAGAAVLLGELELELGRPDASAARFEEALADRDALLTPEERARARTGLAVALALAGRKGEAELALDRVPAPERARTRGSLETALRARDAARDPGPPPAATRFVWAHDTLDWYVPENEALLPRTEPVLDADRAYLHDGSHAVALSLATGKALWRTALRPGDDAFHHPSGPCRLALGAATVACVLPLPPAVVALDRSSGALSWRLSVEEVRKAARIEDECFLAPTVVVGPGVVVVALVARHADDELHLVGLDARTGAFRWRTFLGGEPADPDAPWPVLAEGPDAVYALSCRGVVAAVEPATGAVTWLRRYPSARDKAPPRPFRGPRFLPPRPAAPPPGDEDGGKAPPPPRPGFLAFVHGKVLACPSDCPQLLAFEPRTGQDAFRTPDRGAHVLGAWGAGVVELRGDGAIVLVGRTVEKLAQHDAAELVGAAAVAGDALLLPLKGGLVRVDLAGKEPSVLLSDWALVPGERANVAALGARVVLAGPSRTLGGLDVAAVGSEAVPVPDTAHGCCLLLGAPSFAAREAAQAALLARGEAARSELAEAARSSDPEVAGRATFVLEELARRERVATWTPRIRAEWLEARPGLLDRLTHRSPDVRTLAVGELGALKGPEVAALLRDLLADPDTRVSGASAIALFARGDRSGVERFAGLLDSPARGDREAVVKALAEHGRDEDFPLLERAARDEDPGIREEAIRGALRRGGERAVPLLEAALDDKDDAVRMHLAATLREAKLPARAVLPLEKKLAKDPLRSLRDKALEQLGVLGRLLHDREAFGIIGDAITDADATVARSARTILNSVGPDDADLIPREAIEKALDQPNQDDRERFHFVQLAEALLANGGAFAAGPLARTALETKSEQLGRRALEALFRAVQVAPVTSAEVALVGSLTCRDDLETRFTAYQCLARAKGPDRGPWLLRGLEDPNEQVRGFLRQKLPQLADPDLLLELLRREAAAGKPEDRALAGAILGEDADEKKTALVPVLLSALDDADERVRARAWARLREAARDERDLGTFEPGASPAERSPSVKSAALWWWERTHGKAGVDALVAALLDANGAARFRAAKKLLELAEPAFRALATESVLDALARSAQLEPEEYVQRQKLATLSRLVGRDVSYPAGAPPADKARALEAAVGWRSPVPK